jgi:16S rRNA G966 N2-methylase RsmD
MTDTSKPPKQKPWSDIDLNRWREYDDVLTDSLWNFPSRASGDGHQLDYHGNYIPQIATQLMSRYSKKDEIVLDLFLGSGTTAIEAIRMERRCIGVELKPDLIDYVRAKTRALAGSAGIQPDLLDARIHLLLGNSADPEIANRVSVVLRRMHSEYAHLLVLHPPYADIIKFSDQAEDLSNAPTTAAFLDGFETAARHGYELLAPGRFAALIIGDKYAQGELVPLGFWCMERMNRIGFKTKAIIVKNIEGNEKGKGKSANLWRYRALAGGYYIFKHEYIIVFFKPK